MLEAAKGLINTIRPVPKHSLFREKGQLNFEQFQIAGDGLTRSCQTWQWVSAPDEKKTNKNLDPNKQYLRTQKVRCLRRIKDIEGDSEEKQIEGGWLAPNPQFEEGKKEKQAKIVDLDRDEQPASQSSGDKKKEGETKVVVLDSDDEEDNTEVQVKQEKKQEKKQENLISVNENYFESLVEESKQNPNQRKYDIYITYYEYQRVPRMWFQGYKGEDMIPLTYKQMLEDVMTDYAEKTVTYENHPFLGRKMPSIHPCKHAAVMKKFIDQIESNGGQIRVQNAMSVFLKFISSVVPTIESDFTSNLDFGGDMAK